MGLFKQRGEDKSARKKKGQQEPSVQEVSPDEKLGEELSELGIGDHREIKRVDNEAQEVVSKAARDDFRKSKIMERGRCPECQGRTENLLFTVVCPACGWYQRAIPTSGQSFVHLASGEKIVCDTAYRGGQDEILCITGGVVTSQVMRSSVKRIDHIWKAGELEQARHDMYRVRGGVCSWCEKDLADADVQEPLEDYTAFGTLQERYVYCSEKCMGAFRKQYPSRIHKNCYEKHCKDCSLCVKRFDVQNYKRHILK